MKTLDHQVEIALATFNGAEYLEEFLGSLVCQSYRNWTIVARDDGSRDGTVSILEKWNTLHGKAALVDGGTANLGVIRNFSEVLANTSAPYVMLADQDDVWYREKIGQSLAAIRKIEALEGEGCPALVFTDLHITDQSLSVTHPSFIRMQGLEKLCNPHFRQLLTQNVAPGCTMIVNRALLEIALPIPSEAAMHDWWLIQVASLFGSIGFIDEPTIAYRQHGNNQVGATARGFTSIFADIINGGGKYKRRLGQAQMQAGALIARYADSMNEAELAAAVTFSSLSAYRPLYRQFKAWRHGLSKAGFVRNAGFYCLM